MAEVVPFKGVLYNPEVIDDMADVTAPPYDVISPKEQDGFYRRHPNNMVRLVLGQAEAGDKDQSDIHARAAGYFRRWLEQKVLVQDAVPAFYLTRVIFSVELETKSRLGLIGCVRLEPFEKGIVLPHERTFSKVKSERLKLMQACHSNFSPIFGLYSGSTDVLAGLEEIARSQSPDMDLTDDKGSRHTLWRIIDGDTQSYIQAALAGQSIYIADGHHRYETALDYREWVKANDSQFDANHPANFVMMSLSSLKDPGMVILPAHRLIKDVSATQTGAMLSKAGAYFEIQSFCVQNRMAAALAQLDAALAENRGQNAIGMSLKDQPALYVLVLKNGVMGNLFGDEMAASLLDLDVSVLTRLVMTELLGFDQARLDDASKISYATTSRAAVTAVQEGGADMAFILNPTKIGQVQRVAEAGLIMPRKSTYFFPKVISGQVMNLLY